MVCLEPWTSPRNSLVNGLRKILIPPNSSQILDASILIMELIYLCIAQVKVLSEIIFSKDKLL